MTAPNRRVGFGHTLGVDSTGGTSFTLLGSIVGGWNGPNGKKETPDITLLSDSAKQFGQSQYDGGEVTFPIMWDLDNTDTTIALNTLFTTISQTAANWQVTYGAGSSGSGTLKTETFKGHVVGLKKEVKVNEYLMAEVTIKVSGAI